jgi:hypothetical protein
MTKSSRNAPPRTKARASDFVIGHWSFVIRSAQPVDFSPHICSFEHRPSNCAGFPHGTNPTRAGEGRGHGDACGRIDKKEAV